MVHNFKDHSRDHKIARDNIKTNIDAVCEQCNAVCNSASLLHELINITAWYLSDEMVKIDEHYEDAPLEHLNSISNMCGEYYKELLLMETSIRQMLFILRQYYDFDTNEMICTGDRLRGDK